MNSLNRVFIVCQSICNTELNDLRIIICLRKSGVTVEIISVCNIIEKLMEYGIHCLACSYTNNVINMIP